MMAGVPRPQAGGEAEWRRPAVWAAGVKRSAHTRACGAARARPARPTAHQQGRGINQADLMQMRA